MESTNVFSPTLNVFRVKRKRTADPHEALLVSLKRPRLGLVSKSFGPMLYRLATTSEVPDVATIGKMTTGTQLNIIDYDPLGQSHCNDMESKSADLSQESNSIENLNDAGSEIGFPSGHNKNGENYDSGITLNGVSMASVNASEEVDNFVFDFYYNSHELQYDADQYVVRPARLDELELYAVEDTESSTGADEDDDSNREDNWRNDYPDEESDRSWSSETEDTQFDVGSESYEDLNDRFDNIDLYLSDDS